MVRVALLSANRNVADQRQVNFRNIKIPSLIIKF